MKNLIGNSIRIWLVSIALLTLSTNVCAASEYAVKSAILFKITKFVQWPSSVNEKPSLKICVVGDNPFGKALDAIDGKVSQGKEIQVAYLEQPSEMMGCNIAFLYTAEEKMKEWVDFFNSHKVLTISDRKHFAKQGGMVELEMKGKRVGFLINRNNAAKAGFKFKSQLLRLAKIIKSQGD